MTLSLQHQRSGQRRENCRRWIFESQRLAQLDLAETRVAVVEERAPEQESRFGEIRLLLEGCLELDHGSLRLVLGEVVLC
jgi:hypothetical protein